MSGGYTCVYSVKYLSVTTGHSKCDILFEESTRADVSDVLFKGVVVCISLI